MELSASLAVDIIGRSILSTCLSVLFDEEPWRSKPLLRSVSELASTDLCAQTCPGPQRTPPVVTQEAAHARARSCSR